MDVKYFIRYFEPLNYLFAVVYYTDFYPDGMEINLPLPLNPAGNAYLEGEALDNFIMAHAPYAELREREHIAMLDTTYIDRLIARQDPSFK